MLIYKMSQIASRQYIGYIQQNLIKNHFIVILWSICETFIKNNGISQIYSIHWIL